MASTIETKIGRISTAVTSALSALTAKGVTVPAGANVESLAALIESIEAGGGDISSIFGRQTITGTFTLASDSTSYIMIDIGQTLDKLPSLYFLFCDDTVGDLYDTGHRAFYAARITESKYSTGGVHIKNGAIYSITWGDTSRITKSKILAPFKDNYPGLSGQTFRWIVFV